ncbi:glycosyltransferase family 2 protein [Candidatus Roizmanbacteria bacterium]|nr:glycosyltransferase family 2 protein [Candidatus Roizmanbacteria bacterium]
MRTNVQFSLIVCCYNEEENLEKTVATSVETLTSLFKSFEIIIIDDASWDKTYKIATRLAGKYSQIRIIKNIINLGQGLSFLIGLKEAKGNLVMQNGADRPFDIRDLKKVLPLFLKNDIVVVTRIDRSVYSFWRKFTSWVNIILRWILFDREFNDLNFVQIYKKKVIKDIKVVSISAAFVTQELVLRAKQKGYKITQIRLPCHKRIGGEEHHGKKRDIIWALSDMISFWLENRKA